MPLKVTKLKGWRSVDVPDAAFSWLPFTVEKRGGFYRPKGWDLSDLRPAEGKAYYVSTSGSNGNTGLSWAQAYRSIWQAATQADVNTIYIEAGFYDYTHCIRGIMGYTPAMIAVGGRVINSHALTLSGWSAVDNHYEKAGVTQAIGSVLDALNLNAYGDYTKYTLKTSSAEVDAEPGSYYKDGANVLYVRCSDDREPSENLRVMYDAQPLGFTKDDCLMYMEGIDFEGGVTGQRFSWFRNASAAGGTKIYAKDCTFKYNYSSNNLFDADGVEVILQGCEIAISTVVDGANYTPLNGVAPKVIEIDCIMRDCGLDNNDQASTSHDGSTVVRIGGQYYRTTGQNVADVGATAANAWLLGCDLHDGTDGYFLGNAGSKAWLDGCLIHDCSGYGINAEAGTTVYTRDVSNGNGTGGAGTVKSY